MQPLAAQQGSVECRRGCSYPSCDLILTGKKSGAVVVCSCVFSLKFCWICSFRDLTRKREGKNPLGFGRRAAEWGASESCRKEGIQGPRSTAPREWLPSWGKEQPAWLKWRNWAKLGTFSPSKGDVWPKVSRACCFSLQSGAFEPLRTNLGEFQ